MLTTDSAVPNLVAGFARTPQGDNRSHEEFSPSRDRMSRCIFKRSVSLIGWSIPQQLIDAGLGARFLVHAFDDDGAVEARAGLAILHRLAGYRARHHDRISRHFAHEDLTGYAVDDLGRGADEHAHREHRTLAQDHALGDFRAGADKAI